MQTTSKKTKSLLKWFLFFTFLALLATIYLVYLHYENPLNAPCNINSYFNCDAVNKSKYSELFGVPVAVLGLINYIFLLLVGLGLLLDFDFTKLNKRLIPKAVLRFLFGLVSFGVAFSLYLSYAEFFIIQAVCIFCLTQQILIIADMIVLWRAQKM